MKVCRTVLLNNLALKQNCKGLIHLKDTNKRNIFFIVLGGRIITDIGDCQDWMALLSLEGQAVYRYKDQEENTNLDLFGFWMSLNLKTLSLFSAINGSLRLNKS